MSKSIQNLLNRINYIEAEIEVQKHILFSLSENETREIEKVMTRIAQGKDEIIRLRTEIAEESPEEFNRIIVLEKAVEEFKSKAEKTTFSKIESSAQGDECKLYLIDGTIIQCLIIALEEQGNYTVITLDGELKTYGAEEIKTRQQ